mmetsp:Transcript_9218/g.12207  ORF Transcript_9218/g.12207 Transcript_9218/m.12207 type:complete len:100 (+) Transcript_9218:768-1067(+)
MAYYATVLSQGKSSLHERLVGWRIEFATLKLSLAAICSDMFAEVFVVVTTKHPNYPKEGFVGQYSFRNYHHLLPSAPPGNLKGPLQKDPDQHWDLAQKA